MALPHPINRLYTAGPDGIVRVFSTTNGALLHELGAHSEVRRPFGLRYKVEQAPYNQHFDVVGYFGICTSGWISTVYKQVKTQFSLMM